MPRLSSAAAVLGSTLFVAGCAAGSIDDRISLDARPVVVTTAGRTLKELPRAKRHTRVAVYNIADKTGQRKPSDTLTRYSTAVTQGADDMLVDVLRTAGEGSWFRVVERNGLNHLLQERKIIELNLNRKHARRLARYRADLAREITRLEDEMAKRQERQFRQKSTLRFAQIKAEIETLNTKNEEARRVFNEQIAQQRKTERENRQSFDATRKANLKKFEAMQRGQSVNTNIEQIRAGMKRALVNEESRRLQADNEIKLLTLKERARQREQSKKIADLQRQLRIDSIDGSVQAVDVRIKALRKKIQDEVRYGQNGIDKLPGKLTPLVRARYIVAGAIVGYDSNEITKGLGARFLGIGGDTKYRHDIVTVALRLIDVETGEILLSTSSTKHIYSILLQSGVYKFVSLNKILEAEGGVSRNEPPTLAVRHAMEHALHAMIVKGTERNIWHFANSVDGSDYVDAWRRGEL